MLSRHAIRHWIADLFFLGALFGVFYAVWLGAYPLFTPDEGRYSEIAREMVASRDYVTPRLNGVAFFDKPVLYYWLQAGAIRLFGIKEWALRFWPMVMGTLGCLMVYAAGRILLTRRAGILSASILATSPLYFGLSHYANLDVLLTFFLSGSMLFFLIAMQTASNSLRYAVLFFSYAFCSLAILTKGLIGIVFPAAILFVWLLIGHQWRVLKKMHLISGFCLILCIVMPWYYLVQQANPQFLHFFLVVQQFSRFISSARFNNETHVWFYVPVVLMTFLPWTVFLFQSLRFSLKTCWQNPQKNRTILFLMVWMGIILLFFSIPKSKTISRILPLFPAMALLVGHYLDQHLQNEKPPVTGVFLFAILSSGAGFFLTVALFFHFPVYFNPAFTFTLQWIGIILMAASAFTFYFLKKNQIDKLFFVMMGTSFITLATLTSNISSINPKTIKPLAMILSELVKSDDEVVTFYGYYQDLPIYIQRRITIVLDWKEEKIAMHDNWKRELWFNMPYQDTSDWLVNETEFWARWQSKKRLFVLLHGNILNTFFASLLNDKKNGSAMLLGSMTYDKNNMAILVSNQA